MLPTQTYLPAILWMLLSTFIWTVIFSAGKFADGSIGVFQLTFLRYVGGLTALLALLPSKGGFRAHISRQPKANMARALCACGAAISITWASANMPLIDATAISMSYGIFGVLLGAIVLKETIRPSHWTAVSVSLAGVAIVMVSKGAFQGHIAIAPTFIAVLSAIFLAIEGLLISILGRSEKAFTVMLYVSFFGCGLMLPAALLEWTQPTPATFVLCLALGPLGILGQYCTIRGYRSAPLSVVAPVDYSWLFFSALLGLVVFNEVPTHGTWLGCLIVALGGVLLIRSGKAA
ncbi:EamA domain-containing membrane protein RarD [Cohaesibacter sp. ES.047]|uniref:DMT family transporter n=1 Tax=Cohaesibacter sp. ES.047 TaxID=1798205 RepID=UPI000BB97B5F|nr:DMT family transporter [Cohaesibacter sp. ES.047]SNY91052.1 EamA domain-containing membrane protein RarD [Cohaesibacter sp. ES.047]